MYKLLNAGFTRIKKDKIFYIIIIITVVIAISFLFNSISNSIKYKIDTILLSYIYIIGLFMAMFTSLFTGKEYSYGTIRNKITVGHNRKNIYLSSLIFSIIAGIIFEIVYMLIIFFIGSIAIGKLEMPLSSLLLTLLEMLFIIIAYASIFNLITILCTDMTISVAVCMLLFLAFYIISSGLSTIVNAPEYITSTSTDEYGNIQIIDKEPNPNYPSNLKMAISKTIYYAIPTGSAIQISGIYEEVDTLCLFSYLTIVIFVCNGVRYIFLW